jgi:Lamin Tail Domain
MFAVRASLVAILVAGGLVASLGAAQPCSAQLKINEILADPGFDWDGEGTVSSRDDEWVEIVNAGSTPVVLDDYRLTDAASASFRFGFSGTLLPGAVQVVYGSMSVAWEAANGQSSVGLSLNNAGDTVQLWQIAGTDTVLVDSYTYAAFEVLDDRSTARMPDGAETWQLFDARTPYTGTTPPLGTGCEPTPGASNGCPTAVDRLDWGSLKKLYDGPLVRP